jgi:hypothetical protein
MLESAVEKVKEIGSSCLPSVFGPPTPEQEQKMELERKQELAKDETGTLLKHAPLAILLTMAFQACISFVDVIFKQSALVEEVLEQAQDLVNRDADLVACLGAPVRLGKKLSLSRMKGQQVRLQLPVLGGGGPREPRLSWPSKKTL